MVLAAIDPVALSTLGAALLALAGVGFSLRAGRTTTVIEGQASLLDDQADDRQWLRTQVLELRQEVDTLKTNARETEQALVNCRESEASLRDRIARLEGKIP